MIYGGQNGQCVLNEPIEVIPHNPTLIFRAENYGNPLRDASRWTLGGAAAMQRLASRLESISELFTRLDIDLYADPPGEPVDEPEPPKRDDLWGFAEGDRVRVTEPGAHHGLAGKVFWTGGCSIAKLSETCRDICANVAFTATHRIDDDGTVSAVRAGGVTCPPAHLEHCD